MCSSGKPLGAEAHNEQPRHQIFSKRTFPVAFLLFASSLVLLFRGSRFSSTYNRAEGGGGGKRQVKETGRGTPSLPPACSGPSPGSKEMLIARGSSCKG